MFAGLTSKTTQAIGSAEFKGNRAPRAVRNNRDVRASSLSIECIDCCEIVVLGD